MAELIQHHPVDRTGWPAGPWDNEPDRMEWVHAGLACLALRNMSGAWCGYVGVPSEHRYYQKQYDEVHPDVHGGLTYSAECRGHICHVPAPGMPEKVWWLGFDCAHVFDIVPHTEGMYAEFRKHLKPFHSRQEEYRDMKYIRREVNRLAQQLANEEEELL